MFGGSGGRLGGGNLGILILAVIALLIIIWAATGVYTVSPGENAALRLFGAVQGAPVSEEGLHWWWPTPVGNKGRGAGHRNAAYGAGLPLQRSRRQYSVP